MSLEVVTGCMFSGKTEELVRRLRRCQIAGKSVRAFKPDIDTRYHQTALASHLGGTFEATPVADVEQMKSLLPLLRGPSFPQVVGFDEAQFMASGILAYLETLANFGVRVIVAGLDTDSSGKPFGPMPQLMAVADKVTKLSAICVAETQVGICGKDATRSYRIPSQDGGTQVQVGAADSYEARCRSCWARGQ